MSGCGKARPLAPNAASCPVPLGAHCSPGHVPRPVCAARRSPCLFVRVWEAQAACQAGGIFLLGLLHSSSCLEKGFCLTPFLASEAPRGVINREPPRDFNSAAAGAPRASGAFVPQKAWIKPLWAAALPSCPHSGCSVFARTTSRPGQPGKIRPPQCSASPAHLLGKALGAGAGAQEILVSFVQSCRHVQGLGRGMGGAPQWRLASRMAESWASVVGRRCGPVKGLPALGQP